MSKKAISKNKDLKYILVSLFLIICIKPPTLVLRKGLEQNLCKTTLWRIMPTIFPS